MSSQISHTGKHCNYVCMHVYVAYLLKCKGESKTELCNYKYLVCFRVTDVIVEVCHPRIVKEFGVRFLSHAHFLVTLLFTSILSPEILSCVGSVIARGSSLIKFFPPSGGQPFCPLWPPAWARTPHCCKTTWENTLCAQWCIMGWPRYSKNEWQRNFAGAWDHFVIIILKHKKLKHCTNCYMIIHKIYI